MKTNQVFNQAIFTGLSLGIGTETRNQGSISPAFYEKLLQAHIPKVQKNTFKPSVTALS
jgi:hypothetical protein